MVGFLLTMVERGSYRMFQQSRRKHSPGPQVQAGCLEEGAFEQRLGRLVGVCQRERRKKVILDGTEATNMVRRMA